MPLLHPAILIPTPPVGTPIEKDGKKLVSWRWDMIKMCVPHARMYLDNIPDTELNAQVQESKG